MHLEWEVREDGGRLNGGDTTLAAVLVELRTTSGSVEKHVLCDLGSIETRFLTVNIPTTREFHRGLFWAKVARQFERLEIGPDEKAGIESAIAERIPRPGQDWALWGVTCIPRFDKC